jgi:hypothetical protein
MTGSCLTGSLQRIPFKTLKKCVAGVDKEVNIITCADPTVGSIIGHGAVDINAVACAIHVSYDAASASVAQSWTVMPSFWHFFLKTGKLAGGLDKKKAALLFRRAGELLTSDTQAQCSISACATRIAEASRSTEKKVMELLLISATQPQWPSWREITNTCCFHLK